MAAFLISACALGSKLLGTGDDSSPENQLCATLLGIAVYIFLMTFLVRLPVNYPAVYMVLLAIPVLIDIRGVGRRLASWVQSAGAIPPAAAAPGSGVRAAGVRAGHPLVDRPAAGVERRRSGHAPGDTHQHRARTMYSPIGLAASFGP